jgi:hypothetical protein
VGALHDETYFLPVSMGAPLDNESLRALVADLIARRLFVGPYKLVTGELTLPFSRYAPPANTILDDEPPPPNVRVAYRGSDANALLAAIRTRTDDAVIYFSDFAPCKALTNERTRPSLLYALATPRELSLHHQKFDADFREIPGTAHYRACSALVVIGTELVGATHEPVPALTTVLERHLGRVERQYDILH